jgi:hypothetical protein
MLKYSFLILSLSLFLQACSTRIDTPHGDATIRVDGDRHHSSPPHCPPGHAKKGWC